jgi:hypothetical protein
MRIGSIVMDCKDFDRMMRFWAEALHYAPRGTYEPGWVILRDPTGRGPNVSINRDPDLDTRGYRLHLDLYTEEQEREVHRLLQLGATLHRAPEPGDDFVVLADPEGNLFCVVDTKGR